MNQEEKDQIDDLFDRSNWPPQRTGRLPAEPNQQALPGTPAAAIEMAECRFPKVQCPICDQREGHADGCGVETLNKMIDDTFLYGPGGPPIDVNPASTRELYEGMRAAVANHKVIVIVGDSGVPSRSIADLVIGLGHHVQAEAMTVAMLKARGPGDASLVICDAYERLGLEELGMPPALAELRQGRLTAEDFGFLERNWDAPPIKTHNRSDTGRHGPHNSFHRKSKKGRK